jgi:hypothetical protein
MRSIITLLFTGRERSSLRIWRALRLGLCAIIIGLVPWPVQARDTILFIRSGTGTVGFLEGGSDEQGADIFNFTTSNGNHGWGELAAALKAEGFTLEQRAENPVVGGVPTPLPLDTMDLSQYAVIVFGSNNAEYTPAQVNAFFAYIQAGGAALFISDANFGQNWGDAPSSDQHFLDRFGLVMNQDNGTYTIRRTDEFAVPAHPILNGVNVFDGEGVSPITVGAPPPGVTSTLLTRARNNVRRNTGSGQGPTQPVTASDASLVIAETGSGRIAGHFDRNTFFNLNGAGTSIYNHNNEAYARNLFNWLAGRPAFNPATDNYAPRAHFPNLIQGTTVDQGTSLAVNVVARDPDGSIAYVDLFLDGSLVARDASAPYSWTVTNLSAGQRTLTATAVDDRGASTSVPVTLTVRSKLDRSGWSVAGFRSNGTVTGTATHAIDGSASTRWTTGEVQTPNQRFVIDFGRRELFERIVLRTEASPNDYPRGYAVRGSHDGVNYVTLATGAGTNPVTDILLAQPATYRHVELRQTGTVGTVTWWSIHELDIYAPEPGRALPYAAWSLFHFGAELDDPAKEATHWGPQADLDGDGLTTLVEFAFNTSPRSAASRAEVAIVGSGASGGLRFLDVSYRQWREPGLLTYQPAFSNTLGGWSTTGFTYELLGTPEDNGDGTETVTFRLTPDEPSERGFFRLQLTLP